MFNDDCIDAYINEGMNEPSQIPISSVEPATPEDSVAEWETEGIKKRDRIPA